MFQPTVYIMTNKKKGTLYIGVTSNLIKRIYEHKQGFVDGFTKRYDLKTLAYYELHSKMEQAILREKQMKKWLRNWKIKLIEQQNPEWRDLYVEII